MKKFRMTDMSEDNSNVNNFLGIKITWNKETQVVPLSQEQYILSILEKYRMSDCNPVTTPMKQN